MGQKVNPVGLRLGINRTWDSRWFADGADYGKLLHEDIKVRRALKKRLYQAGVSRITRVRGRGSLMSMMRSMQPGRGVITITRSERKTASAMLWVMNKTVIRRSLTRFCRSSTS